LSISRDASREEGHPTVAHTNADQPVRVEVDLRALELLAPDPRTDDVTLRTLRTGALIHLPGPVLGMVAGYWRADYFQGHPDHPGATRLLELLSDTESRQQVESGVIVCEARVAAEWTEPGPTAIEGIRLGALRALLADLPLPDDALVVIAPAEHPWEDRWSPMSPYIHAGLYAADTSGGGNYGVVHDPDPGLAGEDAAPHSAITAVVFSPSN